MHFQQFVVMREGGMRKKFFDCRPKLFFVNANVVGIAQNFEVFSSISCDECLIISWGEVFQVFFQKPFVKGLDDH